MKLKKLLLLILPLLMLSSCWLYHGDPPPEYESAYFAFVNETDQEIWIDSYKTTQPKDSPNPTYKVVWRIKVPAGEEVVSYLCDYMYVDDNVTVFSHKRSFDRIDVWKDNRYVNISPKNEKPLFLKSSYEKANVNDGKADFKYTYRFTEDFFKDAIYGRPGDLEDPKNVVGNTNN